MGAASSIETLPGRKVHISFPYTNHKKNIQQTLKQTLETYHVQVTETNHKNTNVEHDAVLRNTELIIICIIPETLKSFSQCYEIEYAHEKQKRMLFLMMDPEFTPIKVRGLNALVENQEWITLEKIENVEHVIQHLGKTFATLHPTNPI